MGHVSLYTQRPRLGSSGQLCNQAASGSTWVLSTQTENNTRFTVTEHKVTGMNLYRNFFIFIF